MTVFNTCKYNQYPFFSASCWKGEYSCTFRSKQKSQIQEITLKDLILKVHVLRGRYFFIRKYFLFSLFLCGHAHWITQDIFITEEPSQICFVQQDTFIGIIIYEKRCAFPDVQCNICINPFVLRQTSTSFYFLSIGFSNFRTAVNDIRRQCTKVGCLNE